MFCFENDLLQGFGRVKERIGCSVVKNNYWTGALFHAVKMKRIPCVRECPALITETKEFHSACRSLILKASIEWLD